MFLAKVSILWQKSMAVHNIFVCARSIVNCNLRNVFSVGFSTSTIRPIKQVVRSEVDGKMIIEAVYMPSNRSDKLVKIEGCKCGSSTCICNLDLDVKHTDVLILSQFLRTDGCMLPRRVTGLCKNQQKRVTSLVAMAQKAGLMSSINPANSKKDPRQRSKWKKWNSYWDESTIKW